MRYNHFPSIPKFCGLFFSNPKPVFNCHGMPIGFCSWQLLQRILVQPSWNEMPSMSFGWNHLDLNIPSRIELTFSKNPQIYGSMSYWDWHFGPKWPTWKYKKRHRRKTLLSNLAPSCFAYLNSMQLPATVKKACQVMGLNFSVHLSQSASF